MLDAIKQMQQVSGAASGRHRRRKVHRWAILPILVFPGTLVNTGHGQNGFVTAACFGWSMVLSRRRPFLAGACLGFLVIKPHLLLAAPVVLLTARRWTVIAGGGMISCDVLPHHRG
jgi:hypothetical protein